MSVNFRDGAAVPEAVYVLVAVFIYSCPSQSDAGAIMWTALTTAVRFAVAVFFVDFSTGIPAQSIISTLSFAQDELRTIYPFRPYIVGDTQANLFAVNRNPESLDKIDVFVFHMFPLNKHEHTLNWIIQPVQQVR